MHGQVLNRSGGGSDPRHGICFRLCQLEGDATDYEIAKFLGKDDPNYVRPRRYELLNRLKVIEESRERPCKVTGKKAIAWKIRFNITYFRRKRHDKRVENREEE